MIRKQWRKWRSEKNGNDLFSDPIILTLKWSESVRISKATLSLIPLLGIQYSLFPYLSEDYGVPKNVANISSIVTIFVTASHGVIVSFLYCFTSNEMRQALVRRWKLHKELKSIYTEISQRRGSRDSSSFFSRFYTPRNSMTKDRADFCTV